MLRRTILLISFTIGLLAAATISADDKLVPTDVIGNRFKLKMKSDSPDRCIEYVGTIKQIDQQSVVLSDVTQFGRSVDRGIPFYSNLPANDRLFKNVVGRASKKLDYGIVLRLDEIDTWERVESESKNNTNKRAANPNQVDRSNRVARLKRINDLLSQDRELSKDERRAVVKEIDLLRKSISNE